jgi:hypothetical protein
VSLVANGTSRHSPHRNIFGRYRTNNGQRWISARVGYDAIDPTATLAVHCGNGFDAGFDPYQSARLNG